MFDDDVVVLDDLSMRLLFLLFALLHCDGQDLYITTVLLLACTQCCTPLSVIVTPHLMIVILQVC